MPMTPIAKAKKGDLEAFKIILRSHSKWLLGLMRGLTNETDAEDLSQMVWINIWKHLKTLKEEDKFRSWVRTIAVREAIRHQKKVSKLYYALDLDIESIGSNAKGFEKLSQRQQLEKFLSLLSDSQRTTFVLFELEELKSNEIAKLLNIPEGTVKSRLNKVKRIFGEVISEESRSSVNREAEYAK